MLGCTSACEICFFSLGVGVVAWLVPFAEAASLALVGLTLPLGLAWALALVFMALPEAGADVVGLVLAILAKGFVGELMSIGSPGEGAVI